jgi:hypothetical protein
MTSGNSNFIFRPAKPQIDLSAFWVWTIHLGVPNFDTLPSHLKTNSTWMVNYNLTHLKESSKKNIRLYYHLVNSHQALKNDLIICSCQGLCSFTAGYPLVN